MARRITCEQISPILSAYLDGELSRAERESVEWHLKECERCRGELERVRLLTLQVEEIQPPLSLRQRIMARVEKEKECETIRPLLTAYIDGYLSKAEKEQVDQHINSCELCRKELEGERRLRELLGSLPELEAPRYLRQRIYASIERRPVILRRIAFGFTALAAAASLVLFALPSYHPTTPPTTPSIAQRFLAPEKPAQKMVKPKQGERLAMRVLKEQVMNKALREKTVVSPSIPQVRRETTTLSSQPKMVEEIPQQQAVAQAPSSQPSGTSQPVEIKEPAKVAEHPQPIKETAPTEEIKVAIKPQPSVSELLKEASRSFQKPSLPSKIGERLEKSIVIGVAKIEF